MGKSSFSRINGLTTLALICFTCCARLHEIPDLPSETYSLDGKKYADLVPVALKPVPPRIKVDLHWADTSITLTPWRDSLSGTTVFIKEIKKLALIRHTFDLDILTIPFKIRPSVQGFPNQLNSNFSAALYAGRRYDVFTVTNKPEHRRTKTILSGVGFGIGGFWGLGSVTMNPYVTQNQISYEYDGFVLTNGLAGIYDAKKFNLGIAAGADFLMDKNRRAWLYQGQPWFGLLFGLNLN